MNPAQIHTYESEPAAFRAYDARFPAVASEIAASIAATAPELRVEHVGSTSVPGCGGKGIIDLAVLYPPGQLQRASATLYALGFQAQGSRDPFPESRPMRVGAITFEGSRFLIHAHVLEAGCSELSGLVAFRNRLRAEPQFMREYESAKQQILASISDPIDYCDAKSRFIEGPD